MRGLTEIGLSLGEELDILYLNYGVGVSNHDSGAIKKQGTF